MSVLDQMISLCGYLCNKPNRENVIGPDKNEPIIGLIQGRAW